jgi:hypothetical protein
LPVFDLLIIFVALIVPYALGPLGAPGDVIAPVQVATVLIWPGYATTLLLWAKDGQQVRLGIRLALAPFLSVLMLMAISLLSWAAQMPLGLEGAYAIVSIGTGAMLLAIAIIRLSFGKKGMLQAQYKELAGTFSIFAALALLVGMAAIGPEPQQSAAAPYLTIFMEPASAPTYDLATDTVHVPLIVETGNALVTTPVVLTASVYGQEALSGLVNLTLGEETRVSMDIPAQYLAQTQDNPVDIQARLRGHTDGPSLRVWLRGL